MTTVYHNNRPSSLQYSATMSCQTQHFGESVEPDTTSPTPPASADGAALPLWGPLAVVLADEDDLFVSKELPELVRTDPLRPPLAVLEHPQVQARLCAMQDAPFVETVLTFAGLEHVGHTVLFLTSIMERIAALAYHHYKGSLLRGLRDVPGFDVRTYDREDLRPYRLRHEAQQAVNTAHAVLINGNDIEDEDINWLWEPYVAKNTITMLDGDPGVGKTMLACQLAANVSRGFPLPDQYGHMTCQLDPGNVLLVGMEDRLGAVVKKRLVRCGADMRRLTFCNDIVDANGLPRPFTLADLPLLTEYLETCRPTLVYIDSIQGVLGGKVDIGSPNQVKALLMPLERLAQQYNCAIVCSRHPSKPGQNIARLIHRGMGSQSFIGSARSGLFIEEYPGDKTRSLLVHYKSNSGSIGCTQLFSKAQGQFEWGGISRVTESMLAGGGRGPDPLAFLAACFWLEGHLRDGQARLATEVEQAADEADFGNRTLKSAKKALAVVSKKVGEVWYWSLPPLEPPTVSTSPSLPSSPTLHTLHPSGGDCTNAGSGPVVEDQGGTEGEPVQEGQEGQEDQECKVTAVLDVPVQTNGWVCYNCQGKAYWLNVGGQHICAQCHPQAPEVA